MDNCRRVTFSHNNNNNNNNNNNVVRNMALYPQGFLSRFNFNLICRSEYEYELIQHLFDWISGHCTFNYDVLINFCGDDESCYSFTGFLYNALRQQRFNTFLRYVRLKAGNDKISVSNYAKAIERSKVSIIVFSKSYALDVRCLHELVHIVKQKRLNNQQVFPIFYNLEPSHVRYQTESFSLDGGELNTYHGKKLLVEEELRSALFERMDIQTRCT
ncbi:hypothetical protein PIB30_008047 [Stylosanthes scabra]|uniref:TIR domain-containing protein n=1 Tax=Stylosanthes scabra TaxID=79078 RepID=A0ABU6W4C3_9FABA|nr:hypothetical protein [Stylosanthes scabra]